MTQALRRIGACCQVSSEDNFLDKSGEIGYNMKLDRHLHTCVTTVIRGDDPDERERVIEEIMRVFEETGKL